MRSLKQFISVLLLLFVLLLGVLFSIQNTATTSLDLLIVQLPEQRVALWVLLAFAVGGVTGLAMSGVALVRLKSQNLLMQRKINKQEQELANLRTADLRPALPKNIPSKG